MKSVAGFLIMLAVVYMDPYSTCGNILSDFKYITESYLREPGLCTLDK